MQTISNKTLRPLRIGLQRGKILHLGPGKTGQISDDALELPSVRRLIDEGTIEIVAHERSGTNATSESLAESTQGHRPPTHVAPKGDR